MLTELNEKIKNNDPEIIKLRWKFHCFLTPKKDRWKYKDWYDYIVEVCKYDLDKFLRAIKKNPSFRENVFNFIKAKGWLLDD